MPELTICRHNLWLMLHLFQYKAPRVNASSLLPSNLGILDIQVYSEALEVDDDEEHKNSCEQGSDVGSILAVESLVLLGVKGKSRT